MKVLHFIHGLNTGGAETLVKNYFLNFDRNKLDLVLLCLEHHKDSPYERMLADGGVRIIFVEDALPFKKHPNKVTKAIRLFYKYIIIRKIIRRESPDVIHLHLFLCRFIKFARPIRGTKMFYTVHSEPKKLWVEGSKNGRKEYRAAKWLVEHYNMKFIVLHEKMRVDIKKLFRVDDSILLNNGIDMKSFRNAKSKKNMRKKLGIPEDAFVIGHVGRFSKVKRHGFLVDLFSFIKSKKKNAFLLMVGKGDEQTKIVEKLRSNGLEDSSLILSSREDIPDLLAAMDIFVFPSQYEGLGIALIEAQEANLPCFISEEVPEHAVISNLVTRLSIKGGVKLWADTILNYSRPKKTLLNDNDWDIEDVTKELEQIYYDACSGETDGKK